MARGIAPEKSFIVIRKRTLYLVILVIALTWLFAQFVLFSRAPTVIIQNHQKFQNLCSFSPQESSPSTTTIFIVTPTYTRPVQKAELTRLLHTFTSKLLDDSIQLHWIIVEDAPHRTNLVASLLSTSGLIFTHLHIETPPERRVDPSKGDRKWSKPRGVLQRNEGVRWVRQASPAPNSVLYFADDDNTYDLELFSEIKAITTVGVWPVAFVGELMVEKPVISSGRVVGWDVAWKPDRPFALDMAGFAVNVQLILDHPDGGFDFNQPVGYQETYFLKSLGVRLDDLQPRAEGCTRVLVWHTRTEKVNLVQERKRIAGGRPSDRDMEV